LGAELGVDPRASWCQRDHRLLPPDRYSVHCTPQIHGSLLNQLRRARQIAGHEAVECAENTQSSVSHGSRVAARPFARRQPPGACAAANLKAAIAALASISERRLAKLLDPAQNNGLPASLVPNPDGNHYGLMVLRYRAATLVSELSDHATPISSMPPSFRGDDESGSAAEFDGPTPISALCEALQSVLALERYAAVQALRVRMALFARVDVGALAPMPGEFALRVIQQFEGEGLATIWAGRTLRDEIDRVRGMMGI
jgi:histidine ammonia-lyase